MVKPTLNPFIYGKPVSSDRFIGGEGALGTLFSRIYNGESTAVVGEPHIGKSSILRYIADEKVRAEWLEEATERCVFIEFDCHLLPGSYQPADFWRQVLIWIEQTVPAEMIQTQLDIVRQSDFGSFTLKGLFDLIGRSEWSVVLLIDEFDTLLHHSNFNTAEFFGALRALATGSGGLVLVTAGRISVAEMNRRSQQINPLGSPFFNNFTDVQLLPFHPEEVDGLLDQALEGVEVTFSQEDRMYIRRMTGCQPYLVQAAASALFDAVVEGKMGEERYHSASTTLQHRINAHFDDLWQHLNPQAQTAMVILSLAEMKGHVDKRDFNMSDLGNLDRYDPDLTRLADLGLVEKEATEGWHADWGNFVFWRGNRWRVSAGSFIWWVADYAIAGTRHTLNFEGWLHDREFEGLLTRGEKEQIKALVGKIPKGAVNSVGKIIGTFLKGLLAGKG